MAIEVSAEPGRTLLICLVCVGTDAYSTHVVASQKRFHLLKKHFQLLIVFLGCLQLLGGPYCVVQLCAWGGMLVSYSQDGGIVKAAKDTFSGEKPCALCCKIALARVADHSGNQPLIPFSTSLSAKHLREMIPTGEIRLVSPRSVALPPVKFTGTFRVRGIVPASPPTPPPRMMA